ncbi:MAG: TolC family protein [Elusimicrobia bacterium]|nr:TolC family protein [Elusimicrobiota bacterium]MDE2237323.1 TolC family protein [Elusimicrobiota bacterium]MDE2426403.1 TolC family protein [Elusimicrobiota bacterium]
MILPLALVALSWPGSVLAAEPSSPQSREITLQQAYELALKRSEAVAEDRQAVAEALARVDELRAAVLPHLSFLGQQTFQQSPRTSISSINNTSIPDYSLQLQQPLFSGFREFLAFRSGRKAAQAITLTERRAESLLYQDVAQAYFNLDQIEEEIGVREEVLRVTAERIKQLKSWVGIGRSRESEVLDARSLLAQTQAQVEIARGSEQVAQETLRFLTGEEVDYRPQPLSLRPLGPLEPFLATARRRDDVLAAEKTLEARRLDTKVAARQRWGSLGLTGDYYLKRVGFSGNIHYDAILGLSVPIFDGGSISAQTREARAQARSAEQALSAARRLAESDTRAAYLNLKWSLSAVNALRTAEELAAADEKAQEKDYGFSLVTNLQVLDSINSLQAVRLQLDSARHQALFAQVRLQVASAGPLAPRPSQP